METLAQTAKAEVVLLVVFYGTVGSWFKRKTVVFGRRQCSLTFELAAIKTVLPLTEEYQLPQLEERYRYMSDKKILEWRIGYRTSKAALFKDICKRIFTIL